MCNVEEARAQTHVFTAEGTKEGFQEAARMMIKELEESSEMLLSDDLNWPDDVDLDDVYTLGHAYDNEADMWQGLLIDDLSRFEDPSVEVKLAAERLTLTLGIADPADECDLRAYDQ